MDERGCFDKVVFTLKPYINRLYDYYKQKDERMSIDEENPKAQMEEMIAKHYLSQSYMTDMLYMASCLFEGENIRYARAMGEYITRIENFLDV